MKRSLVRSVSVLIAILALTLGTMAAPAFAGDSSGAGALISKTLGLSPGDCAWVYDQHTTHFFVGFRTQSPGIAPGSLPGIAISGALTALPAEFGTLTFEGGVPNGADGKCLFAGILEPLP